MDSSNPSLRRPGSVKAGATVDVVSPAAGEIKGWDKKDWGRPVKVDRDEAEPADYDALVLPAAR